MTLSGKVLRKLSPIWIAGIVLTLGSMLTFISGHHFIQALSNYTYDAFLRRVHKPPQTDKVVIIDIDDQSLQDIGQWPWPRFLLAQLAQKLFEAEAAVVVFDIVFPEEDRTSPAAVNRLLQQHFDIEISFDELPEHIANFDNILAQSIGMGKSIVGCFLRPTDTKIDVASETDPHYRGYYQLRGRGTYDNFLMQADDIVVSIPVINAASQSAFFNASPDADGIVRSNPLVWSLGPQRIYPSLALEAVRLYRDIPQGTIMYDEHGITEIRLRDLVIPTDRHGRLVINYRTISTDVSTGFSSSFPTYPAKDVLAGRVPSSSLKDKIVFIGTSAVGLKDIRATPLTQWFSGVEIHAVMVDNMLSGDILRYPAWISGVQTFFILLVGMVLTAIINRGRSWLSFILALGLIVLSIMLSLIMMGTYDFVFIPVWLILTILILYPFLTMMKFWQEERQKIRVRNMFGTMVSQDVLSYLENNPESFSLTGHRTEATMMFSDVAGFTTISENLEPERLSELLNRYLSPMSQIIMDLRGYIDKYEGDAIMAEWGVPFPLKDHAVQACKAALKQQQELAALRPVLKNEFGHDIYVRMGVNSGSITAGNMGSDKRFQYTVMGDAVNLAARLEPANKDYGTDIIIGSATRDLAGTAIEVRLLDRIVVKGKTQPVEIYELLGMAGEVTEARQAVVSQYEQALHLHWDRKWDEALQLLDQIIAMDPNENPARSLKERILFYRNTPPPPEWQGEYVRTSKD